MSAEIWEQPQAEEIYMIVGWRQWADGGSISSGLPHYLIQETQARQIGRISPGGYYLFQIPGTHDLVRPIVQFKNGFPESLDVPTNEFFYAGDAQKGIVFFLGDEPQINVEGYVSAILDAAEQLNVKRIISFGGVYGELPYDKERHVHAIYSQPSLKDELDNLSVNFSEYHGGASIGSFLCRRAAERDMPMVGLYAMVPTYDFSQIVQVGGSIRLENDFVAWLGVMRRLNYMLKFNFDLSDLEERSQILVSTLDEKIRELEEANPEIGISEYLARINEGFEEIPFMPLDDVWEDELRQLFSDEE